MIVRFQKTFYRLFALTIILLGCSYSSSYATHIRAGDLTAVRIDSNSLTYHITVILYLDTDGIDPGDGFIDFGAGEDPLRVSPQVVQVIPELRTQVVQYSVEYTFPSAGFYKISYFEDNRNANVNNMALSVDTPFYIESEILINPVLGLNSTPLLSIAPLDGAVVGQKFTHNPGAYDKEGDSLSYELTVCKQARDLDVLDYTFPDNSQWSDEREDGSTPAIFSIDPLTGDLVWDAPGVPGEYNVAFYVNEWRDGVLIGRVNRDMQIIVREHENQRPNLILPADTCLVAGSFLQDTIQAIDPDGDFVQLTIAGDQDNFEGLFNLPEPRSSATFELLNLQPPNGEERGLFSWQTSCLDVRREPYLAVFKAEDQPEGFGRVLADIKSWLIRVIGPAPENFSALANEDDLSIELSWDVYTCPNAERMTIWRRRGSYPFEPAGCTVGIPEEAGYERIGEVDINQTSFLDDNNGDGLERGVNYCYRIYAVFPEPAGGESYASVEVCAFIPSIAPYITNVSVLETGQDNGQIEVIWTKPQEIDPEEVALPITYQLERSLDGEEFTVIASNVAEEDTTFLDSGINTLNEVFTYKVGLYDANSNLLEYSLEASSVRLSGSPTANSIDLNWSATVPWNNSSASFPFHYVYRKVEGEEAFTLIDSVDVFENGFQYEDTGGNIVLEQDTQYCYYITTSGSYENDIIREPLLNNSQEFCSFILDEQVPCPPILSLKKLNCDELILEQDPQTDCVDEVYVNELTWIDSNEANCEQDIVSYNLYYSPTGTEGTFELLVNTPNKFFNHEDLVSVEGCYAVTAVDEVGNESPFSNIECNENCPFYKLPNAFTPRSGNNNINSKFVPIRCPRFVQRVEFKVYNRWGELLYESDDDIYLNWRGVDSKGSELSQGVYYYTAQVTFYGQLGDDNSEFIKGWVYILY